MLLLLATGMRGFVGGGSDGDVTGVGIGTQTARGLGLVDKGGKGGFFGATLTALPELMAPSSVIL